MKQVTIALLFAFFAVLNAELIYSLSNLDGENVLVTLTNTGDKEVTFLSYDTAFDSFVGAPRLSLVDNSGRKAQYVGKIGKRVFPAPAEFFITLAASESISAWIDIHEDFHIHEEGEFVVSLVLPHALSGAKTNQLTKFFHKSPTKTFHAGSKALTPTYNNCNADQIQQVEQYLPTTKEYQINARDCTANGSCADYAIKWLGVSSGANYDYVKALYVNIVPFLDTINIVCNDPGCGFGTFAFVYPDDPLLKVYLCSEFFDVDVIYEKYNTFIHEASHFQVIGNPGTGDVVYGVTACLSLAQRDSFGATHNADSIAYMAVDVNIPVAPTALPTPEPSRIPEPSRSRSPTRSGASSAAPSATRSPSPQASPSATRSAINSSTSTPTRTPVNPDTSNSSGSSDTSNSSHSSRSSGSSDSSNSSNSSDSSNNSSASTLLFSGFLIFFVVFLF